MRKVWFLFISLAVCMLFISVVILTTGMLIAFLDLSAIGMFAAAAYYIGKLSSRTRYINMLCCIGKWDYSLSKMIYGKWFKIDYQNTFGWWLLSERLKNNINTSKRLFADNVKADIYTYEYPKL